MPANPNPQMTGASAPDSQRPATQEESLSRLFSDFYIESLVRFRIGQTAYDVTPGALSRSLLAEAAGKQTRFGLAGSWPAAAILADGMWPQLYQSAYMLPYGKSVPPQDVTPEKTANHLAALREAFPEGALWSPAWQVYQRDANGSIHVKKGDCCRLVQPGAYMLSTQLPENVSVGTEVSILISQASSTLQPSFYHMSGRTPMCDHDNAMLGRLYLHSQPGRIIPQLRQICDRLNSYAVPYHAKTVLDLKYAGRSDGTVLYTARRYMPFVLSLLQDLLTGKDTGLLPDIPLFSKPLAPGLGAADDPGMGLSFGEARCMILAEALIHAWSQGDQSVDGRWQNLRTAFAYYGLDPDHPHLSHGNIDIYSFPAPEVRS